MSDFYDKYRQGFGMLGLTPDCVDAACEELLRAGEPREAIQILRSFDMLPEPLRSESRRSLIWLLRFVPNPPSDSNAPLDSELPDDGQCIELHDPDYSPALEALKGPNGDARPIARLLKRCVPMPHWIGRDLGVMLDPSSAYRGNRLDVKVSKKTWRNLLPTQISARDVGNRLRALVADGWKWEAAVAQVVSETGLSKSYVEKCTKIDDAYLVRSSQGMLGYDDDVID